MPSSKSTIGSKKKSGATPSPAASARAEVATPPAPPQTAAPPTAQPITSVPPALQAPDVIATYQTLYDTLGRAYWEASDLQSKDTIQGSRDAIYDILTDLNIAKLKASTALYLSLIPRIRRSNEALKQIQGDIDSITKNIATATSVISAITKVLNIAAMF
ncbi:MAG: hypothetical protein JST61_10700 [Acidobacteria bacterium]|nr:hypothetical protein [Acidobacteriota bacterium]